MGPRFTWARIRRVGLLWASLACSFEGLASSLFDLQPQISILCSYAVERFKNDTHAGVGFLSRVNHNRDLARSVRVLFGSGHLIRQLPQ